MNIAFSLCAKHGNDATSIEVVMLSVEPTRKLTVSSAQSLFRPFIRVFETSRARSIMSLGAVPPCGSRLGLLGRDKDVVHAKNVSGRVSFYSMQTEGSFFSPSVASLVTLMMASNFCQLVLGEVSLDRLFRSKLVDWGRLVSGTPYRDQ